MRLFTCIPLPPTLQHALQPLCTGLPGVRWTQPDQLHLTLVFIGDVNPALLLPLQEALQEVPFYPFSTACQQIGTFRSGVIWLGVEPVPELLQLEKEVRRQLRQFSEIRLEGRKYLPHITLGRFKPGQTLRLQTYLQTHGLSHFDLPVDAFELMSSQLTARGAIHQSEGHFLADEHVESGGSVRERLKRGDIR